MFLGKHSSALPPLISSFLERPNEEHPHLGNHQEPINPPWRNCSKNIVEIDFALLLMNLFHFVLNVNKNVDITLSSFVISTVRCHRLIVDKKT